VRINIYAEELPTVTELEAEADRVNLREKQLDDLAFPHYGIQFLVGTRNEHTPGDDDTSGVTFWFSDSNHKQSLAWMLKKALETLEGSPL
jgi:hypothetical protein